ncbi:MAG: hypothetical protein PHW04_00685 [Candidatus Wallbacteria bacterium]|nr:hypothetical protein [Candidatus Wallbacteria bacterium]
MNSKELALEHFLKFFELRMRVTKQNDALLQREAMNFFGQQISPRICSGPAYDQDYCGEINRLSREQGFLDMMEVFVSMPGK